jgi:putative transposase
MCLVLLTTTVGHCADNATCKVFLGVMKRERINLKNYRTLDEEKSDIFDYIERFHNPRMRRRLTTQDQRFSALLNCPCKRGRTH